MSNLAVRSAFGMAMVLFTYLFMYQNCAKSDLLATGSAELPSINGGLEALSDDGQVSGEITLSASSVEDVDMVEIQFFAIDGDDKKHIGSFPIEVSKLLNGGTTCNATCNCSCQGDGITFPFVFLIPKKYRCYNIVAYYIDPRTEEMVQVPAMTQFLKSARKNKKQCEDNPGEPTDPEATPTPKKKKLPSVDIDHIFKNGRLIEIVGLCQAGAGDLEFSGDLLPQMTMSTGCETGSYRHCAMASLPFQKNKVTVTQKDDEGNMAHDSGKFTLNHPPVVELTIEDLEIINNGKKAKIYGKCTKGSKVTINIYNNDVVTLDCEEGYYEYKDIELVNVAQRFVFVTQVTSFGVTTKIWADVDGKNTDILCLIKEMKSNEMICKEFAGTVKGRCHAGLPVKIYVNDQWQDNTVCSSEKKFEFNNVLLDNLDGDNTIRIEQKSPFGHECSDSKMITVF